MTYPPNAPMLARINCPDRQFALSLAETLVGEGLAPCANVSGPHRAIYRWHGEICRSDECIVWLKAPYRAWSAIHARARALHPDETPAILALACLDIDPAYGRWLDETAPP